jgi:hypothetical protein
VVRLEWLTERLCRRSFIGFEWAGGGNMPCSDNLVCGRASSGSAGTSSRERIEGWDHAIDCVGVVGAEGG